MPNIDGLEDFKGVIAHTANYPENLTLEKKRVAVVGNGSSGIQIVAEIQPYVDHLYTWIRSPTWMTPGFAQKWAGKDGGNFKCERGPDTFDNVLLTTIIRHRGTESRDAK